MTKKLPFTLFMILFAIQAQAQYLTPFVSVDWLKENLDREDLVILHVGPEKEYYEKHIPGAQLVQRNDYVFSSEDESSVYDLPTAEELTSFMESKGVTNGDTIILYVGTTWVTPTTRLYYTFDYLGYTGDVFILDGGLTLWEHEGGEISSGSPSEVDGSLTPRVNSELVVSIDYVKENLGNTAIQIVDARASAFYEGVRESMGASGHIPGAKTIPYSSLLNEGPNGSYVIKTKEQLQEIFDGQELDRDKPVIVYCHIGQQATLVYTAAKMLGYKPVLFDGSFHAWSHGESNPTEKNRK